MFGPTHKSEHWVCIAYMQIQVHCYSHSKAIRAISPQTNESSCPYNTELRNRHINVQSSYNNLSNDIDTALIGSSTAQSSRCASPTVFSPWLTERPIVISHLSLERHTSTAVDLQTT